METYFTEFKTKSGLRVFHRHVNLPWTAATIFVNVGHRDDPLGKEGCAHLLEHQINSGTETLPRMTPTEFRQWFEDRHFLVNQGSTDIDFTTFGGRCTNEIFGTMLQFLNDFVRRPRLDSNLEHDRAIVRAERIDMIHPRRREANKIRYRAVFGNHRIATVDGLPKDSVLNGLTMDDIRRMHRDFYDLPNMVLVTLGGISTTELEQLVEQIFVQSRPDFIARPRPEPIVFSPPNPTEFHSRIPEGKVGSVKINYSWFGSPSDAFARALMRICLSDVLLDSVREQARLTYHISARTSRSLDYQETRILTEVTPEKVDETRALIENILRDPDLLVRILPEKQSHAAWQIPLEDQSPTRELRCAIDDIAFGDEPVSSLERAEQFARLTSDEVLREFSMLDPNRAYVEIFEK